MGISQISFYKINDACPLFRAGITPAVSPNPIRTIYWKGRQMTRKKKLLLVLIGLCALVGCYMIIVQMLPDFPTADDAQQAGSLARGVEAKIKENQIAAEIYCRPAHRQNTLLVYGNIDKKAREKIVQFARDTSSDINTKKIEIQFYEAKLNDANDEKPTDVVFVSP